SKVFQDFINQEAKTWLKNSENLEQEENLILCQGEQEAMFENQSIDIPLPIQTSYDMSPEAILIRVIESSWYAGQALILTGATYHVKPKLKQAWQTTAENYATKHNFLKKSMLPHLLFHGTNATNHK